MSEEDEILKMRQDRKATEQGLYDALLTSCIPTSSEYDESFHRKMFKRQPQWFDGTDGLFPPTASTGDKKLKKTDNRRQNAINEAFKLSKNDILDTKEIVDLANELGHRITTNFKPGEAKLEDSILVGICGMVGYIIDNYKLPPKMRYEDLALFIGYKMLATITEENTELD